MPIRKSALTGDALRVALLDAAGALLQSDGPHALSTRRLADLVGTSTQSIYTLFGGMQGVLRAMYLEGFDRLTRHMRDVAVTDDPLADLHGLGRAYRASAKASPHLYSVMFERPVAEFECSPEDLAHALSTLESLAEGVQRALDAHALIDGIEAFDVAIHVWVAAHGFVSLELSGHLLDPPTTLDQRYDAMLSNSIAPFVAAGNRAV